METAKKQFLKGNSFQEWGGQKGQQQPIFDSYQWEMNELDQQPPTLKLVLDKAEN